MCVRVYVVFVCERARDEVVGERQTAWVTSDRETESQGLREAGSLRQRINSERQEAEIQRDTETEAQGERDGDGDGERERQKKRQRREREERRAGRAGRRNSLLQVECR